MCGIVGALVFDGSDFRISEPYLTAMRDTMPHRGPDGAGLWIEPRGTIHSVGWPVTSAMRSKSSS